MACKGQQVGLRWIQRSARDRQKSRRTEARQLRRLYDSPSARKGVGSAPAVEQARGGGRLGPLNGALGSELVKEAGARLDTRLNS
jgi:hypothetical protein